ncbi:hypothetical protein C5B85_12960 [Pseudoclavibacter sp. AY1F1]|uniref:hypothetical protein n=1 Tax=Pseudoclavibacter sp. AY1F1 TaxID=2080583 RepID=UPI000CE7F9D6|nr:hypothetical protein [Pseudoclavibacter sp. AY1F1]PPF43603.1 hypothetical protein C5B85_12960 [Pseudoclavibacter sp. AY1F1]
MDALDQKSSRRSVIRTAAWAAPVIAVSVATPFAAASGSILVDLASTARLPIEASNGSYLADPYYQGPRVLTFRATYRNNGPDALPAGGIIQFGLPFAAIWVTDSLTIIEDTSGRNPAFTGTSTADISIPGSPAALRRIWSFQLPTPLAAGASFDLVFRVELNGVSNTATNFYRVRSYTNIGVGATGAIETDPANNPGYSNYAYFNNENAS